MSLYFLNETMRGRLDRQVVNESFDLPVKIEKTTWAHFAGPNRISKNFDFEYVEQLKFFLLGLIDQFDVTHHPIKLALDDMTVTIELYTRDIDDVTEVDIEIARLCDDLYNDSLYVVS